MATQASAGHCEAKGPGQALSQQARDPMRVGVVLKDANKPTRTIGTFQKEFIDAAILSPHREQLGFGEYAVGVDKGRLSP
jgi:hypothetical protein